MTHIERFSHGLIPQSELTRRLADKLPILHGNIDYYKLKAGDKITDYPWIQIADKLYKELETAIQYRAIQRGWKIYKEIGRTLINGLAEFGDLNGKKAHMTRALAIFQESLGKMEKDSWRQNAILSLLAEKNEAVWKLKADIPVGDIIKANEILDEYQDNFYEKLMTLNSRIRLLSLAALGAIALWLAIAPPIGDFPRQKDVPKEEMQRTMQAIQEMLKRDSIERSTPEVPLGNSIQNQADTIKTADGNSAVSVDTSDQKTKNQQPETTLVAKPVPPQTAVDKTANPALKSPNTVKTVEPNPVSNKEKQACLCPDPTQNPRHISLLVILMGIIGAIASGFIRAIQSGTNTSLPDQLFGTTILTARIIFATVAAIAVYIFLGTGIVILFNTKISFELLLAFCFAAGFSEQLVQKGVETLTKEEMYAGKKAKEPAREK